MKTETRKAVNKIIISVILVIFAVVFVLILTKFGIADGLLDGLNTVMGRKSESINEGIKVTFVDVGQGDCALIECGGKTMLIDSGENGNENRIKNLLISKQISRLDYVVASHPHSDHIGSLPEIINEFGCNVMIMPQIPQEQTPTSAVYSSLIDAIENNCDKTVFAVSGDTYRLADAVVRIIAPISANDNLNDNSTVIKVVYGEISFLFCGDASRAEETDIIISGADIDCDVLKVGHHGSDSSSNIGFLERITPRFCVISCGENNDYGHPDYEAVKRLEMFADKIYRTDISGNIVFVSDGKSISVQAK